MSKECWEPKISTTVSFYLTGMGLFSDGPVLFGCKLMTTVSLAAPPRCGGHSGVVGITRQELELYYRNVPR